MSFRSDVSFPEREQDEPEYDSGRGPQGESCRLCDRDDCRNSLSIGAVFMPFGSFCSRACADVEEKKFAARLEQRQRQRRSA